MLDTVVSRRTTFLASFLSFLPLPSDFNGDDTTAVDKTDACNSPPFHPVHLSLTSVRPAVRGALSIIHWYNYDSCLPAATYQHTTRTLYTCIPCLVVGPLIPNWAWPGCRLVAIDSRQTGLQFRRHFLYHPSIDGTFCVVLIRSGLTVVIVSVRYWYLN